MKLKLQFVFVMLCLVGCSNSPTPIATVVSLPATPSPEILPTLTSTISPTELPSATLAPTLLPTSLNTELIPNKVGVCPTANPDLKPDFSSAFIDNEKSRHITELSLAFLNQGGSAEALHTLFTQANWPYYQGDLTGDGIPEIGLVGFMQYDIIGCIAGTYVTFQNINFGMPVSPEIYVVEDMNLNEIPDVVFFAPMTCGFHACFEVFVFEWNKTAFQTLSKEPVYGSNVLGMNGPFDVEVKDVDDNGTLELILKGGIPFWDDYYLGLPWRSQADTYMWDGEAYSLYRTEFASPQYRFQAVQDGDQATQWGEYEKAIDLYQQAIFSDKLDFWSPEQLAYEQDRWLGRWASETPTPAPTPKPDPAEYPNLAAYARYRIMLLHLQQGYGSDAKVVYDTLQEKFPKGQAGHAYAEMATAFWSNYQEYQDLRQACTKAIEYASLHKEEILSYLGNIVDGDYRDYYHGEQSHYYQPEDICPFH